MRYSFVRGSSLPLVVIAVVALVAAAAAPLAAQSQTGGLWVRVKVSDNALAGLPARVSAVSPEGTLVDYAEELLDRAPNVMGFKLNGLKAGVYDVRVEGEGLITEVKRGVPVFADRDENLAVVVKPGEGIHVVEYAVACLSREEVAARLAHLEAETTKLRAELEALRSQP